MTRERWDSIPFLEWADPERTREVLERIHEEVVKVGMSDHELGLLYELAKGLHGGESAEGYVVELGSWFGASTVALALAVRDAGLSHPVVAVDYYGGNDPDSTDYEESTFPYIAARETYHRMRLAWHYIVQVVTLTNTFGDIWAKPIRLLFIDSSHTYEVTSREIEQYVPHVVEGGWVVFHDYEWHESPECAPAVNDWLATVGHWDIAQYRGDECTLAVHIKKNGAD